MKSRKYRVFVEMFDTKEQAEEWLNFINNEYNKPYYNKHYKKYNKIHFNGIDKRFEVFTVRFK